MVKPAASEAPLAVEVVGLNKTFNPGHSSEVQALKDLNMSIAPGEFVSIIGPSGCGKSTLLRLLAGLLPPTTGTVRINGKPALAARKNLEYGIVFQSPGLLGWRTVAKNVELPLEIIGWSKSRRRERSAEMLELVELSSFAKYFPQQLSGGMQQRVSIARALSFEPSLLLMDEPFGALDEITRESMQNALLRIWREFAVTIVFVTHSIPEAVFLSTSVSVLSARPARILKNLPTELGGHSPSIRGEEKFFHRVSAVREVLRS